MARPAWEKVTYPNSSLVLKLACDFWSDLNSNLMSRRQFAHITFWRRFLAPGTPSLSLHQHESYSLAQILHISSFWVIQGSPGHCTFHDLPCAFSRLLLHSLLSLRFLLLHSNNLYPSLVENMGFLHQIFSPKCHFNSK